MKPRQIVIAGIAAVMAFAALWHGPLGQAGVRFAARAEALTRLNLDYYDMDEIDGFMQRGPLTRRMWLAGPADDFQRGELDRIIGGVPGVVDVRWWRPGGGTVTAPIVLPLVVEAELVALGMFALGFIIAYLVALRRRAIAWSPI
ncbi:hypothetical protein [Sphingomicrobium nitratireducens]|uniref:hypothetical protein n=1 Tax=Sphingomicrobium nitratireducens TaxID=2964666 RepID=UPI0022400183|nr:hypothetical protein [Sphingomicrobium nitratireducens]